MTARTIICLAVALIIAAGAPPVRAETAEEFYKGKVITFLVGSDPGGSFGVYAEILALHMPKHIPGTPKIITKFTGGQSGGLQLANSMHSVVAPDGLTIAMTQQTIVLSQVLTPEYAKYDARQWIWLGNMAPVRNMLAVWHTAKAQSVEEAKNVEVIIGATGPTSPTYIVPKVLNQFLGTKFKIVSGYKGAADLSVAMERGEIEGRGASWLSLQLASPQWITEKKVKAIVFASMTREPTSPDTPTLVELVTDPVQKQAAEFLSAESDFGRSVFLPPGVPAERAAALRNAFEASVVDPELLTDAKKRSLPIEPTTAENLQRLTEKVLSAPQDVVALAK
jgi:tripartite-type tricarboxylate transporter receptor subunit TctC